MSTSQALQRAMDAMVAGRLAEADAAYKSLLVQQPSLGEALHMRGLVHYQLKDYSLACGLLSQAVDVEPHNAAALSNYGMVLRALGRHAQALDAHDKALAQLSHFPQAWANRANVLRDMGRSEEAIASYQQAIAQQPDFASALHGLGLVHSDLAQWPQSLDAYDRALHHNPRFAVAYLDRGNTLREMDRLEEALASYARAIELKPDYAQAWSNRGVVLKYLARFDEARACYDAALDINPQFVDAMVNYSTLLKDMLLLDASAAMTRRALALDPDNSGAHLNLSICDLLRGDFDSGFAHYEWRWKTEQLRDATREFAQPLWLGAPSLYGKTVLLHAEQGLGDTLQFCRYAQLLKQQGARVVMEVQAPLVPLLESLKGVDQCVAQGDALPPFDVHCPLLSLPLALKTTLAEVPAPPHYLAAPANAMQQWSTRLGRRDCPRVGLAWSGRAAHKNDHNRSLDFAQLEPWLQGHFDFHCLQKEVRAVDATALNQRTDIRQWSAQLDSFADTAALVAQLDLVIAVDTSVAHLAAALGKPVWLLLPFSPDWRWLVGRDDTPWYPTMRLFRQATTGDWHPVLQRVAAALAHFSG